jgi:peroxiredoxin
MEEYPDFVERAVFIIDQDGVVQYSMKGNPSTSELMEVIERVT